MGKETTSTFSVTQVKTLEFDSLENYVKEHRYPVKLTTLDNKGWSLAGEQKHSLLNKLKTLGIPLKDYINGKIFYGIKTGLNTDLLISAKRSLLDV